jgi:hypothetical protein
MDPAGKVFVGDKFAESTISPRFSAGVRVAVPLFEHVWLDGLASVAAAPLAHVDPFATATMPGMNGTGTVPGPEFASLPGEPTLGVWLGIGLRIGAR